jgi:hypothetical protein
MAETQNEFASYGFKKLIYLKLSFYFDIISGFVCTVIGLAEITGVCCNEQVSYHLLSSLVIRIQP